MVEPTQKPEILTQRLDVAKTLQVAGGNENYDRSITAYEAIIGEFGVSAAVLNGMGVPLRNRLRHSEAIKAFTFAYALAQRSDDKEAQLTAVTGFIDAYRTAHRSPYFPYPKYIKEQGRKDYLFAIAESFVPIAESIMTQMPHLGLAQVEARTNFGLLYDNMGDLPKALKEFDVALTGIRTLVANDPNNINYQNRLARTLQTQGEAQERSGDLDTALTSQNEALKIYLQLVDRRGIQDARNAKGQILIRLGRYDEARILYEEAAAGSMKNGQIDDPETYENAIEGLAQLTNPQTQS